MSLEVFFYKQSLNQTATEGVDGFLVDIHTNGIPVSKQRVHADSEWFGFAAHAGSEVEMSVTPIVDGRESDVSVVRTLTVPSELEPVPGCILGSLAIEKKHVLCGA